MAKEIPYFKFFPGEWIKGDITLCSLEAQGLFINICAYYWMKDCSMSLANAKQRFGKVLAPLNELLEFAILNVDEDENISIHFLDEQMQTFVNVSEKRSKSGRLGGMAKAKQMPEFAKAKPSNKEKIREDKNKNKNIGFNPPTKNDVIGYFVEKGYTTEAAKKAFDYYDAADWHDSKGNKVKNWKQKMQGVWFKPENKEVKKPKLYNKDEEDLFIPTANSI